MTDMGTRRVAWLAVFLLGGTFIAASFFLTHTSGKSAPFVSKELTDDDAFVGNDAKWKDEWVGDCRAGLTGGEAKATGGPHLPTGKSFVFIKDHAKYCEDSYAWLIEGEWKPWRPVAEANNADVWSAALYNCLTHRTPPLYLSPTAGARSTSCGNLNLDLAKYNGEAEAEDDDGTCEWTKHDHMFSGGYADGDSTMYSVAGAKSKCRELGSNVCAAVTCNTKTDQCTVRAGQIKKSGNNEYSLTRSDACKKADDKPVNLKKGELYEIGKGQCLDSKGAGYTWRWTGEARDLSSCKWNCKTFYSDCRGMEYGEWDNKCMLLFDEKREYNAGTMVFTGKGLGAVKKSNPNSHTKATCWAKVL